MKSWKIAVILGVVAIAAGLLITSVYAYMGGFGGAPYGTYPSSPYGYTSSPYGTYGSSPYGTSTSTAPYGSYYGGEGGWGCPMMRGYFGGSYGYGYNVPPAYTTPNTSQLSINTAATIAQNYLVSSGDTNLTVSQVQEYTNVFYVQVKEKDTGTGAFELLINKNTGGVSPETGPNLSWNIKYRTTGTYLGTISPMTVNASQATANAQQYLDRYLSGTTTGQVTTFYGYYSIEIQSGGNTVGIISVNGYTGQVWYHNWLGTFIQKIEVS